MTLDLGICLMISAMAAFTDCNTRKVRNSLVFPAVLIGLFWSLITDGFPGVMETFLGGALPLVLFPFYIMRMLGAGDIKLLMALGVWLGLSECVSLIAFSILCGGVMALGVMLVQQNTVHRLGKLWMYLKVCIISGKLLLYQDFNRMDKDAALPFALAVLGGLICLWGQRTGLIPTVI